MIRNSRIGSSARSSANGERASTTRWWGRTEEHRRIIARLERLAATPTAAAALIRTNFETDVSAVLGSVRAPTLVVQNRDDPLFTGGRELAAGIPGARFVEVDLPALFWSDAQLDETLGHVEEFVTGRRHEPEVDRVLKTVLFTDIVASTQRAAAIGDRRWTALLDEHDASVRRALERFRGDEIKTLGDGFLADLRRSRACGAVRAQRSASRPGVLGFEVRAGLHTGECEVRGDDLAGIAVHIGARVAALAGPGEVLVTCTVRDLVAGSGHRVRGSRPTRAQGRAGRIGSCWPCEE